MMPTSSSHGAWITDAAPPGLRAYVTPIPSEHEGVAILSALQRSAPEPEVPMRTAGASAWHRGALLEAVGEGDAWEPST